MEKQANVLPGFIALLLSAPVVSSFAYAGSKTYLGSKSAAGVPLHQIDHSSWNRLLAGYVDANGMVDYRGLKASQQNRQRLTQYLQLLSTADPNQKTTRQAKLAFWINAYNAVTIQGILREYPTSSIRNHTARFIGYNIWKDLLLYVGGRPYSLEAIEHEVLRKMNDPRIHFAIVCASVGCPRLLDEAYTQQRVDEQLESNATDFFSRKQNFRYDASNQRFYLSSILSWFATDFGRSRADQLRRIAPWLPNGAQRAARENRVSVSYLNYDWSLNEQSTRK